MRAPHRAVLVLTLALTALTALPGVAPGGQECKPTEPGGCSPAQKRAMGEPVADAIRTLRKNQQATCKQLVGCLERRDACFVPGPASAGREPGTPWVPRTERDCKAVKACLKSRASSFEFPLGDCDYRWLTRADGGVCRLPDDMFAFQYSCPGRKDYWNLNRSDTGYDCSSLVANFRRLGDLHRTMLREFGPYLGDSRAFAEVRNLRPLTCATVEAFTADPPAPRSGAPRRAPAEAEPILE